MKFPLIPRKKNSDKNDYGHVLVIAGSKKYPGAALITAEAALRSGAGMVTLATPISNRAAILKKFSPEVIPLFVPETKAGTVHSKALPLLIKFLSKNRVNAVALGPGLGRDPKTCRFVKKIVAQAEVPVVLDADGLNAFQGCAKEIRNHNAPLILTPHKREFERLFRVQIPAVSSEKSALAKKLSRFYDVVLVLKGHRTLVAFHDKVNFNTTGCPGMAKAGSGDALTGIIASFLAQGLSPFFSALWGVYYHGKAGEEAVKRSSELSLTASDLIKTLPKVFAR